MNSVPLTVVDKDRAATPGSRSPPMNVSTVGKTVTKSQRPGSSPILVLARTSGGETKRPAPRPPQATAMPASASKSDKGSSVPPTLPDAGAVASSGGLRCERRYPPRRDLLIAVARPGRTRSRTVPSDSRLMTRASAGFYLIVSDDEVVVGMGVERDRRAEGGTVTTSGSSS